MVIEIKNEYIIKISINKNIKTKMPKILKCLSPH